MKYHWCILINLFDTHIHNHTETSTPKNGLKLSLIPTDRLTGNMSLLSSYSSYFLHTFTALFVLHLHYLIVLIVLKLYYFIHLSFVLVVLPLLLPPLPPSSSFSNSPSSSLNCTRLPFQQTSGSNQLNIDYHLQTVSLPCRCTTSITTWCDMSQSMP